MLSDISDAIKQAAVDMNDDRVIFYPTGTADEPWLSCRDDYIDYTHPNIEGLDARSLVNCLQIRFPTPCNYVAHTS